MPKEDDSVVGASPQDGSRSSIIKAVNTPLGFFALIIIAAEAIFGGIATWVSRDDRTITLTVIYIMLAIIIALIVVVAYFAYRRPEALFGRREEVNIQTEPFVASLNEKIRALEEQNRLLFAETERLTSLRSRIVAHLAGGSADNIRDLIRVLSQDGEAVGRDVESVVGCLIEAGEIERDTMRGGNYFKLSRRPP